MSLRRLLPPLLLLAGLALPAVAADTVDIFPAAALHLEGVRYQPVEPELQWQGWIGGGADLVRAHDVTLWTRAEVETILGHLIRPFEATQANFHLSLGFRRTFRGLDFVPFFRHVSRHYVDRAKTEAVDWNMLGLEVSGRPWKPPVTVTASLGHTTQASLPGYEWEARLLAEGLVWQRGRGSALLRGGLRRVTVSGEDDTLDRGDFTDWRLEGAARYATGDRALELFIAAERRNDVFLEQPGARQRALFGFRVLMGRQDGTP